jgi:hypothetical protein
MMSELIEKSIEGRNKSKRSDGRAEGLGRDRRLRHKAGGSGEH